MLRKFCDVQRAKYGPDWKAILSAEMAAKTAPAMARLLDVLSAGKPREPLDRLWNVPGKYPEHPDIAGSSGTGGTENTREIS